MNDNFDSNVAKRKPKIKNILPIRPWDVKAQEVSPDPLPSDTVSSDEIAEKEVSKNKQKKYSTRSETKRDKIKTTPLQADENNDLSDTININSNYCKLHNDVSDHLLKLLSVIPFSFY